MTPTIILELRRISKRFGPTAAADDLSLEIRQGEFFTFLGPSGSGKSTILRMVAGLERPDSGSILIDSQDVSNTPPWHRNLGMMFQSYAVFPHMTVADNIGYGLRVRKIDAPSREARVDEMMELVGLTGMGDKNVTLLSGGEQQRVALARALAPQPRVLLLDEPLSALDEKIRRSMQNELRRVHRETGTTFLYVTHDQEEALTMSDRIAVFNRGQCVQCDTPEQLYNRPRNTFVAGFFRGCNVLELGAPQLAELQAGTEMGHIAIRAENIHMGRDAQHHDLRLTVTVEDVTYRGTVVEYGLRLGDGQPMVATTTRRLPFEIGKRIEVGVDRKDIISIED